MHLISPQLRGYAWGTTDDIPRVLGIEPTGEPIAEAWWGAHESGPAIAETPDGKQRLDELIAAEPASCLGEANARRWGDRLPYLLKLLAIEKPLSIQVHPSLQQAREGYEQERRENPSAAPQFPDPFHKPEMVFALTPLRVLAGVRPIEDLRADLEVLDTPGARLLADTLNGNVADYIALALSGAIGSETLAALATCGGEAPEGSSLRVSADALRAYPDDAGALVALALNVVDLAPGESVFVGDGVMHSYQSGLGIEVMANSDNVVRAGLTPKHVDVPLLLSLAATTPGPVARPRIDLDGVAKTLRPEVEEFALTVVTGGTASIAAGPRVAVVVEGEADLAGEDGSLSLTRGQAAFLRDSDGTVTITAGGTIVVAHLPG